MNDALPKDVDGAPARQTSAARCGLAWLLAWPSLAFVFFLGPGIRLSVAGA